MEVWHNTFAITPQSQAYLPVLVSGTFNQIHADESLVRSWRIANSLEFVQAELSGVKVHGDPATLYGATYEFTNYTCIRRVNLEPVLDEFILDFADYLLESNPIPAYTDAILAKREWLNGRISSEDMQQIVNALFIPYKAQHSLFHIVYWGCQPYEGEMGEVGLSYLKAMRVYRQHHEMLNRELMERIAEPIQQLEMF